MFREILSFSSTQGMLIYLDKLYVTFKTTMTERLIVPDDIKRFRPTKQGQIILKNQKDRTKENSKG